MNNDWLKGYIQALENVDSAVTNMMNQRVKINPNDFDTLHNYDEVRKYITQIKNNYKQLVKELNAKEEKAKRK